MAAEEKATKESLGVVIRFRPKNVPEREYDERRLNGTAEQREFCESDPYTPDYVAKTILDNKRDKFYSRFDYLLGEDSSQKEAYENSSQKLVKSVCDGCDAGLFAYGQSGSGKSFTLIGKESEGQMERRNWGLIPRTVEGFFLAKEEMAADQDSPFEGIKRIRISFFEIYQEEIYDLLKSNANLYDKDNGAHSSCKTGGREKRHLEKGLVQIDVKTTEEAVKLLQVGTKRRRQAYMPLNPVSSRSHAIYRVTIDKNNADHSKVVNSLYFADLMGSEKMATSTERADEAPNDELLSLGRVIQSLADKSRGNSNAVATYREHTLTYVLQDVLGGNSKTMVIVTGVLSPLQYKPTQGALDFGDNCKGVQRVVTVEKKPLSHAEMVNRMQSYENQIKDLKFKLDLKDTEIKALKDNMGFPSEPSAAGGSEGGQVVAGGTGLTDEYMFEFIKEAEEKTAKEKEMFQRILAEAQSNETYLNEKLKDCDASRKQAESEKLKLESEKAEMQRQWAETQDGDVGDIGSVTTKFASVLQENTELKQYREELKTAGEKTLSDLRQAESNARDSQKSYTDARDKNRMIEKELRQKESQNQELSKEGEVRRMELLQLKSEIDQLESKLTYANQTEYTLREERDDLRQQVLDKEALEEEAFKDAARADEERNQALAMLTSITNSLSGGIGSGGADDLGADSSSMRASCVIEQVKALEEKVQQRQSEAQDAQANLNKTVLAQQWIHAKDKALKDKQIEQILKQEQIIAAERQNSNEVLQMAHEEHAQEAAKLRKEISNINDLMAAELKHRAVAAGATRQLENKLSECQTQSSQAQKEFLAEQEASKKKLQEMRELQLTLQHELAVVSKKEKQAALYNNKLQHDILVTDRVLADHLAPDILKAIRVKIMDQMEDDYHNDVTQMEATTGGDTSQFGRVHKMYTEVLEQKATAMEHARQLQTECQGKQHELKQSESKQHELASQISSLHRQLEVTTKQMEQDQSAYLMLKEEYTQLQIRARSARTNERDEFERRLDESQSKLKQACEKHKKRYDVVTAENQIKELRISALRSELEVLSNAHDQAQDSKFSSAVKRVIAKQRADRSQSLSKIVEMHNSQAPSTPRKDADTSVEDMYRCLLLENQAQKTTITKLATDLRSAASQPQRPEPAPPVMHHITTSSMSSYEASAISTQLLESRRLMVENHEGVAPTPSRGAGFVPFGGFEAYRQDLLKRAKKTLGSSKGLLVEGPVSPDDDNSF